MRQTRSTTGPLIPAYEGDAEAPPLRTAPGHRTCAEPTRAAPPGPRIDRRKSGRIDGAGNLADQSSAEHLQCGDASSSRRDSWFHHRLSVLLQATERGRYIPPAALEQTTTRRDRLDLYRQRPDGGAWQAMTTERPYAAGSWRGLGVADMAAALLSGRPHRASGERANHVLEIMAGLVHSADTGAPVPITTPYEKPQILPAGLRDGDLEQSGDG